MNEGLAINTSIATICPSGNGFWPGPIHALGICGSCSGVTAEAKVDCLPICHTTQYNGHKRTTLMCRYSYSDGFIFEAHQSIIIEDEDFVQTRWTAWNSSFTRFPVLQGGSTNISLPSNWDWIQLDGVPIDPPLPEVVLYLSGFKPQVF